MTSTPEQHGDGNLKQSIPHSGNAGVEFPVEHFDKTTLGDALKQGLVGGVETDAEGHPVITSDLTSADLASLRTRGADTTDRLTPSIRTAEVVRGPGFWTRRKVVAAVAIVAATATTIGTAVKLGGNDAKATPLVPSASAPVTPGPSPSAVEATPSVTPTPTAEVTKGPETGSVESYQLSVEKYPTPELAIPALGELLNTFETSGKVSEDKTDPNTYGVETPESIHKDDNILKAVFGPKLESTVPEVVDNHRSRRSDVTRNLYGSDAYFEDTMKATGKAKVVGDTFVIFVESTIDSNFQELGFGPPQLYSGVEKDIITLRLVDGNWVVVALDVQ